MDELRHYAQVVSSTQDAVLSKDLAGVITSWNPAAKRLYGYSQEEAVGRHISMLIPADHKNEEQEILARVRRGERVETYETERIRKDGVRIDVSLTVSPIEHPEGIVGASVIARDITAERRRRRAQVFLLVATRGLDASLDFGRTARTIVEAAVPELAEVCALDFVRPDGWIGDSVVGAADPGVAPILEQIRHEAPLDPRGGHPVAQVLRGGRPMVWRDLTSPAVMKDLVQSEAHRELIEETRYESAAVAPLVARGTTIGALSLLHANTDLRYEETDMQLLGELADRAAIALDNARLYEERDRIAQNLQRGLRPPEPPYVPGLDIAVVFEAFGEGMEIGGDLYDIVPTEDGCWILIGDVTGKGSAAAGVAVALRHSTRGLVRQVDNPMRAARAPQRDAARGPGPQRLRNRPAAAPAARRRAVAARSRLAGSPAGGPRHGGWAGAARRWHCARRLGRLADPPPPGAVATRETIVLATDGWFEAGPAATHVGPGALAELAHSLAALDLAEMTEQLRQDAIARSGGPLRDDMVLLALRPGP